MDVSASPALALGVFGASLLGSLHCAAMCGGFACLYGGDAATARGADAAGTTGASGTTGGGVTAPRLTGHVGYHGGRLVAYALLGALAGGLGAGLDELGALAGVQRAAGYAAGGLLLVWGLALLAQALEVRFLPALLQGAPSEGAARTIGRALLAFRKRSAATRATALGLLTGLIPCGWLYAFVVTAGGTGSVWRGAAFMVLFWAGTVPALVAVAVGMQRATGTLQRRLPLLSALLVIGFGVAALGGRLRAEMDGAANHDMHTAHVVSAEGH